MKIVKETNVRDSRVSNSIIEVKNVHKNFKSELTGEKQKVLNNLSFTVSKGQTLAILGESGSGKSTMGKILVGLLKPSKGEYYFLGQNPYKSRGARKLLSQHMSIVFQDYNTSVNPRFSVMDIIMESIKVYEKRNGEKSTKSDRADKVITLLEEVGLDKSYIDRFPHQLSGGQLQRVCIARAIATMPSVILFDEAISSLDAHTQVVVMDLLKEIQQKRGLTYIFITHDLASVTYFCDRVMFLYKGEITELIDVKDISKSKNEYAKQLLDAVIEIE